MKVAMISASLSRHGGGVSAVVEALSGSIAAQHIETRAFGLVEEAWLRGDCATWKGAPASTFDIVGPPVFGYAPTMARTLIDWEPDIVHNHGLWMYPSIAAADGARHIGVPTMVSPHGFLAPSALRNATWKKRIAGWLFENRHLRRAGCLHALNEAEHDAIRAYGLTNPVAVIPNGVDLRPASAPLPDLEWAADIGSARILLFLGRLHPTKGLANLLHAWERTRRQAFPAARDWRLVIAGWGQGGHEAELRRLAQDLRIGDTVRFIGPQFDERKAASLSRADAFILPSLSEGLPIAVLEAWANSLPVLMTPQCNLPEGFATGAGMRITPDADRLADDLAAFFSLSDAERLAMGKRGRELVEERFDWKSIARQMIEVYRWLTSSGPLPTSVRLG